jgi:hypothetical protein
LQTTVLFSHLAPPIAAGHVAQLCTLLAFPTAVAVAITCTYSYVRARVKPEDVVPAIGTSEDSNTRERGDLSSENVKLLGSQKASGSEVELSRESRLASALEMLLLGVGCTVAPPLLGFFLAFCTVRAAPSLESSTALRHCFFWCQLDHFARMFCRPSMFAESKGF